MLPAWFAPAAFAFAASAILAGGVLIAWSLWSDRGRGTRRCGRCWHDLSATEGVRCGECGWQGRRERDLHRTRRHWRSAILGLLLLVCGIAAFGGALPREELWRQMPDRLLVWVLPFSVPSASRNSAYDELVRRLAEDPEAFGERDALRLAERIAAGDRGAAATSLEWEAKYAPLLRRLHGRLSEESPARAVLRSVPPRIDLAIASPWPLDLPPYASLEVVAWSPEAIEYRLEIDCPKQPRLPPVVVGRDTRAFAAPRFPIEFEPFSLEAPAGDPAEPAAAFAAAAPRLAHPPRGEPLELRLRMKWRPTPAAGEEASPWQEGPERIFRREIEPTLPLSERLRPIRSDAADAAVLAAFGDAFMVGQGERPFAVRFDTASTAIPELEQVAIGLVVEVLEEGVPRRRSWIWWPGGSRVHGRSRRAALAEWRISVEDLEALAAASEDGRWTLRVRGDPEMAMRAVSVLGRLDPAAAEACVGYWAGEIEVPLRIFRTGAAMRPRPWFHPDERGEAPPPQADTVPFR